ncbi:TolC family outer membrane protein [Congregibacter variabilis]|uniref:TolC family outer membrane protein n=1 Tax=Congregibacter variabilis TaxID=3081200 RepID=A0ABZ0I793_9GAMM|nr:TolC family outer membrane protein [Congregibacter sp. IMCC43200]
MKIRRKKLPGMRCAALMCISLFAAWVPAALSQQVATYGEAIVTALASNPAVTSAYYEFEATRASERAERGDMLPSVDLSGNYSSQERQTPIADFGDYESDSLRFSITQLLFDGFQSRDEARAKRYEKLARYYDFEAASQEVAVTATQAYVNTVLYQRLVQFAEQNYVVHRQVFNKIAERAAGGVSQRVDLEQATARLALAESNLLTEVTNLHDTRAEFQRIVGLLPAKTLPMPQMPESALPVSRDQALSLAYENSPEINRAIEELRSSRESSNATRGAFYPRLDLRYRNEQESNTDGILGDYDLQAVEVVMSYNLYRGGSDSARRREAASRYYSAVELRKDACLSVRRETMIAFNDVDVLRRQVSYLTQQLDAQDKTRRAYNDQFDIGQRSLLDLLDSQNEYFNTQRALISAQTQLLAAQANTLASIGALTRALDASGFNAEKIAELELDLQRKDKEEIPRCPDGFPGALDIDQEAIFRRLDRAAGSSTELLNEVSEVSEERSDSATALPVTVQIAQAPKLDQPRTYTVQANETLWAIASRFRLEGESVPATIAAIQDLNPDAFNLGDPNSIKAGYTITLPGSAAVLASAGQSSAK